MFFSIVNVDAPKRGGEKVEACLGPLFFHFFWFIAHWVLGNSLCACVSRLRGVCVCV